MAALLGSQENLVHMLQLSAVFLRTRIVLVVTVWGGLTALVAVQFVANFNPLYLLVTVLGSCVLFEATVRVTLFFAYGRHYKYSFVPYLFTSHQVYGCALRPNSKSKDLNFLLFDKYLFKVLPPPTDSIESNIDARFDIQINSCGYRGAEMNPNKEKGKLRVFCSGGSTTACYGHNDQSWPIVLEGILNNDGCNVEVINGGVWSWNSTQELKRFRDEVDTLDLDVVVLHQGWNEEFTYSVMDLGTRWYPGVVRSFEERELCRPKSDLLAKLPFVAPYLIALNMKEKYFKDVMAFTNPERWRALLRSDYLYGWIDNIFSFLKICSERNIALYLVNPPCLVGFEDSPTDRATYINGSRLSVMHSNYQAVSKARISKVIHSLKSVAPCIDIERSFEGIRGEDRVKLFRDEMHLTPEGDRLVAKIVAKTLRDDLFEAGDGFSFKARNKDIGFKEDIDRIRKIAVEVDEPLGRFAASILRELKEHEKDVGDEVPEDMYTTF